MGGVYISWAVLVFAIAAQILNFDLAPGALRLHQMGVPRFAARAFWVNGLATLSLVAWPFVAAGRLNYDNDPSVLTIILCILGAVAIAFLLSLMSKVFIGAYFQRSYGLPEAAAKDLLTIETGAAAAALALTALAWFVLFWNDKSHGGSYYY